MQGEKARLMIVINNDVSDDLTMDINEDFKIARTMCILFYIGLSAIFLLPTPLPSTPPSVHISLTIVERVFCPTGVTKNHSLLESDSIFGTGCR